MNKKMSKRINNLIKESSREVSQWLYIAYLVAKDEESWPTVAESQKLDLEAIKQA